MLLGWSLERWASSRRRLHVPGEGQILLGGSLLRRGHSTVMMGLLLTDVLLRRGGAR